VDEPVGLLIGAVRRRLKQAVAQRVRRLGLSSLQFWALVHIDESEGPSLGQLAERLKLDAPATSRTVTALHRLGLVSAEGDRADRRRLRLQLTRAGKSKMPRLRALAAELRDAAVRGLSREEEQTLRQLLRKVIEGLDATEGK
jgi:DNA-binding MarR family transcriptional regulator